MKRMFSGCWLLSDLDGTLIPTPHKANGQYVPLQMSVCFEPIKRWITNGGNLCVVTTADRRVFDQVYFSLRPYLKSLHSPPSQSGELLLSLYTGASLYRCGRESIEYVPDYCDPTLPAGLDTCMDAATCNSLREIVIDIFLDLASDVIHKRAPMTDGWEMQLSKRYQVMWRSFLRYLSKRCEEREAYIKDVSRPRKEEYDARWGHLDALLLEGNRAQWMEMYLRSKRQLLVKVGIIRQEALRSTEELKEYVLLKTGGHDDDEEGSHETKPVFSDPLTQFASDIKPNGDSKERFAQLIVVGVPLKLYGRYFAGFADRFASMGVHPIAQPNSVVFSKLNVGKGTTVNYLDRKLKLHDEVYHNRFRGMVDLDASVSLGDNPNTADRDLALIPTLQFVSIERMKQREARHALIDKTGAAVASRKRGGGCSKALIDDRMLPNIHYVGNEEDGCAMFLTGFMDRLEDAHLQAGGGGVCGATVCSLPQVFQPTLASVAEAVRNAQAQQAGSFPSKL